MKLKDITFIVEGHDRTGKSTFIKNLQEVLPNLIYYHFMFPQGNTSEEKVNFQRGQFDLMFNLIKSSVGKSAFVFDRAHIGEYIWGPELRGVFPSYMPMLEYSNKDLPIVILFLRSKPSLILERLEIENPNTKETLKSIKERQYKFETFIERSPFPNITIDTSTFKITDYKEIVLDVLKNVKIKGNLE